MRSHTGANGTMGKGSFYSSSTRQKLNTKSSTEEELVAADDILPQLLWTINFMIAQGYKVKYSTLYQDNLSTILLERSGKVSSGNHTRAIDIRYFYITAHDSKVLQFPVQLPIPSRGGYFHDIKGNFPLF